jgi:hypothetical protein
MEMLGSVISTRHRPEAILPMLGRVVSGATILKGMRGEADEVVDSVLRSIGD